MIPCDRVSISYSWAPGMRQVGKVEVTELPPGDPVVLRDQGSKPRFIPERMREREPIFTFGASDPEWMQGHPAHTPAGVFGNMLLSEGFASWQHLRAALMAFNQIEGCDWALQMLGFYHPDIHDHMVDEKPT